MMKIDMKAYNDFVAKFHFPHYIEMLTNHLYTNKQIKYLLNSIFFPTEYNSIEQWIQNVEVEDFFHHKVSGGNLGRHFCDRLEVDKLETTFEQEIDKYDFFSAIEFTDYEEVKRNYPKAYYILRPDYIKRLDRNLFDRLSDYTEVKKNIWRKKIANRIYIELFVDRDFNSIVSIVDYTLPQIAIIIGEDKFSIWKMDVRQFLFLSESSFLFFYMDMHTIIFDGSNSIKSVTVNKDQPVVYHFENEGKYLVTNSWENISRYNRYIDIIFHLSVQYLQLFEKYITEKVIS